jgi:proteasome lid subunit RPN8/RPN11
MPVSLVIPRQLYDEMLAQAQAELPNECCGFLAGSMSESEWRVLRRYPLINKAASPVEYSADGHSLIRAHIDMRQEHLELLAIYHSHPTTEPIPSRKDRELNYHGEVVHLIISLKGKEPEMRGWRLTENDYSKADWECTEDEASS